MFFGVISLRSGGSTSVDVTRKGIDKAYGISRLLAGLNLTTAEILFIGDRLDEGGNDYPVRAMGVPCVAVEGWEQTAEYVSLLLARDIWPEAAALAMEHTSANL